MESATGKNHLNRIAPELLTYAAAAAACIVILILTLNLWNADFHIPLGYTNGDAAGSGDAMWIYMLAKSLVDNGWVQHNASLGMPIGMNLLDFPVTEKVHLALMKIIALMTRDFAVTVNLYFLLGFVLVTLTMVACARETGLSRISAIGVALLYAFLPGHFQHGQAHLFISAYFMIPLGVMVCLWIVQRKPLLFPAFSWRGVTAIVICILSGLAYVYYAFFLGLFLMIAGGLVSIRDKSARPIFDTILLGFVLTISFLVCVSPNLVYRFKNGPNAMLAERPVEDAKLYSLRIAQMVLPIAHHRIEMLGWPREKYNAQQDHVVESDYAALGFVGSCGLLIGLSQILRRMVGKKPDALLYALSILTLSAALIAMAGGLSTLLLMASRFIRSYSRMSFFIAAFSLLMIGYVIDQMFTRPKTAIAVWTALVVAGILDQTSSAFVPDYAKIKSDFESDRAFVRQIEAVVPDQAMIYQLPLVDFPEYPQLERMPDYQLFRGYLHSTKLRWSYGAMKGREIEQWNKRLSNLLADQKIAVIHREGFAGLYIDTNGFGDPSIVRNFQALLNRTPIISSNGRLAFFSLAN